MQPLVHAALTNQFFLHSRDTHVGAGGLEHEVLFRLLPYEKLWPSVNPKKSSRAFGESSRY